MSRIADLLIDIEDMLAAGTPAEEIAHKLNVPLAWVTQIENVLLDLDPRGVDDDSAEEQS